MSTNMHPPRSTSRLPQGESFRRNIALRRSIGQVWRYLLFFCTVVGLAALLMLGYNIIDEAVGTVAVQSRVSRDEITGGRELEALSSEELQAVLKDRLRSGRVRSLEREQPLAERDQADLVELVRAEILKEEIVASWPLHTTLLHRDAILQEAAERYPRAELRFYSWLNSDFLRAPARSEPTFSGVRTAFFGSVWMILITMLVAVPLGVSAAIYLEEYAGSYRPHDGNINALSYRFIHWLNNLIQININNLAGVPSIIYGMLGLAVFVRTLSGVTSGAVFGVEGADPTIGRTILSGSLTMALLILPLIIINAQEAIRAVPSSIRQASYGLGATKWQTIWNHVLPMAFPGILTGTILGMSRAIGETAPLILIGAATAIYVDPNGPFSRFTALPIQIYNWTSQPQAEFRNLAAAAIIVLLVLLLSLNSIAVLLRNRFQRSR